MLDYEEFKDCIRKDLVKRNPGCRIEERRILKNNGLELDGLMFADDDLNIAPTIYLNSYYKEYRRYGLGVDEIVDAILSTYKKARMTEEVDISNFLDFNKAKSRIVLRLVNKARNTKLADKVPHVDCLEDLTAMFAYLMSVGREREASILIRHEHMDRWNTNTKTLFKLAKENTPKLLGWNLMDMRTVLTDTLGYEENHTPLQTDDPQMFVLTNRIKLHGASCLLYPGLLKETAEKIGNDLYIIPSSIHETLLLPARESMNKDALTEMIREVNRTQVMEEEILSDHPYFFSREKSVLMVA